MSKYIDAERLRAEIERKRYEVVAEALNPDASIERIASAKYKKDALSGVISLINSLQQEVELPEKYQTPDWLFEKQEQPVEWSEEEQQIIRDAACTIISFSNTVETKKEEEELCEIASKLQDLKPKSHWKPSEEQMDALNEAIGDYRMEDTASCEKTADILESLYNGLAKL